MSQPLPKRARSILYAVVTEFIASGEPVGSRTLVKKYGFDLSAATIRNVLADLEDAGLFGISGPAHRAFLADFYF